MRPAYYVDSTGLVVRGRERGDIMESDSPRVAQLVAHLLTRARADALAEAAECAEDCEHLAIRVSDKIRALGATEE